MTSKRPYRIWNDKEKKNEPHRCYATWKSADDSALRLIRWFPVGSTLTIYNNDNAGWIGTYRVGTKAIHFLSERKSYAIDKV